MTAAKEPAFAPKTVGIVGGTGPMGQLFAPLFKKSGFDVLVAGRKTELSPEELVRQSDWIIFCVPMPVTQSVIEELAPLAKPGALVSDFTSVKEMPLRAMLHHAPEHASVVGIHPMFGPNVPGIAGQNIALAPGRGDAAYAFVCDYFKKQSCRVIELDAADHDALMSVVQGMNHFDNLVFADALVRQKKSLLSFENVSTPNFRLKLGLISRLTNQNPALYADLVLENDSARARIKEYKQSVLELERIVEKKDAAALAKRLARVTALFADSGALFRETQEKLEKKNGY